VVALHGGNGLSLVEGDLVSEFKSGQVVGPWTLVEVLGTGGNATVWRASHKDGRTVALKILKSVRPESEPYKRFRREIAALQELGSRPGILPILGSSLPDRPKRGDPAWIATPIATPLADALGGHPLPDVVAAMKIVAETLAALHRDGIAHRDVKPANLYWFEGSPVIGDFGLVDLPDETTLTDPDKPLGPRNFIPYEFVADPAGASAPAADVFMFAKTLWVLATDQRWPPQGEQRADNAAISILSYQSHPRAQLLDRLVERATRHVPTDRPEMGQVASDLAAWLHEPAPERRADLADAAARLRSAVRPGLTAAAKRAQIEAEFRGLVDRLSNVMQSLEEQLGEHFPLAVRDGYDPLADSLLEHGAYLGSIGLIAQDIRSTRLDEPADFPISLIIGRSIALTEDGLVHCDGGCFIGETDVFGGDFPWRFQPNPVPIESIQASAEVDRLAGEIVSGLPGWVDAFVLKVQDR
jgi:hypothetical protein